MYRILSASGCRGDVSQEVDCWSVPRGIEPILDLNVERGIHLDDGISRLRLIFKPGPCSFGRIGYHPEKSGVGNFRMESLTLRHCH